MITDQPTILLVDDEEIVLTAIERHLAGEHYRLVKARSARCALDILETTPIQVVVSDFRMPEMNGGELLKIAAERWPDTVRIVLSGYADIPSVISAINEGEIYRFISKPWQGTELKATLRDAVQKHRHQMEIRQLSEAALAQNAELLSSHLNSARQTSERNLDLENAADQLMVYKRVFQTVDVPLLLFRNGKTMEANAAAQRLLLNPQHHTQGAMPRSSVPDTLRLAAESLYDAVADADRLVQYRTATGEIHWAHLYRIDGSACQPCVAVSLGLLPESVHCSDEIP